MNRKIDPQKVIEKLLETKGYLRANLGNYSEFGVAVDDAITLLKEKK